MKTTMKFSDRSWRAATGILLCVIVFETFVFLRMPVHARNAPSAGAAEPAVAQNSAGAPVPGTAAQQSAPGIDAKQPVKESGEAARLTTLGKQAVMAQNYGPAFKYYQQAIAAGSVESKLGLAALYRMGEGVARDPNSAIKLYTEAANAGNSRAMSELGMMYLTGREIPRDLELGKKWTEEAVQLDQPRGYALMGDMYAFGMGEKKDFCTALDWYTKAEAGDIDVDVYMGSIYFTGKCGPEDRTKARFYFERSARAGNSQAQGQLRLLNREEHKPDSYTSTPSTASASMPSNAMAGAMAGFLAHQIVSGDDDDSLARSQATQNWLNNQNEADKQFQEQNQPQ